MPQQVWAFLASNEPGASESWTIRWLAHKLDIPESTVRGQMRRLEQDGKVARRPAPGGGRILFRRVERRPDDPECCGNCGSTNIWWDNADGWCCGGCGATDADET